MHSGWELAQESEYRIRNSVWDCYFVTKIEESQQLKNIRIKLTNVQLFLILNCVHRPKM
jgi:hypothetical protein